MSPAEGRPKGKVWMLFHEDTHNKKTKCEHGQKTPSRDQENIAKWFCVAWNM